MLTGIKPNEGLFLLPDGSVIHKLTLESQPNSLSTIRALKEAGVEVWFEKEAIKTFDSKGELLITIMSSLAQEESFYGGAPGA